MGTDEGATGDAVGGIARKAGACPPALAAARRRRAWSPRALWRWTTRAAARRAGTHGRLVEVVRAEVGSHTVKVTGTARSRPRGSSSCGAVGGGIAAVHEGFEPGGSVAAGETLVTLDDEPDRIALDRARAALIRAAPTSPWKRDSSRWPARNTRCSMSRWRAGAASFCGSWIAFRRGGRRLAASDVADAERELGYTEVDARLRCGGALPGCGPGAEVVPAPTSAPLPVSALAVQSAAGLRAALDRVARTGTRRRAHGASRTTSPPGPGQIGRGG
ncbi:MAG: hypothetical protein U5L11_09265 [Arhodomonas sp.]|nr:hypothetical protein [Arhodomonas sp.]